MCMNHLLLLLLLLLLILASTHRNSVQFVLWFAALSPSLTLLQHSSLFTPPTNVCFPLPPTRVCYSPHPLHSLAAQLSVHSSYQCLLLSLHPLHSLAALLSVPSSYQCLLLSPNLLHSLAALLSVHSSLSVCFSLLISCTLSNICSVKCQSFSVSFSLCASVGSCPSPSVSLC